MKKLLPKTLTAYRDQTFRLQAERRLQTADDAVAFVAERGFVFFWPIRGMLFPSLWTAVAGNRPVANDHGWMDDEEPDIDYTETEEEPGSETNIGEE